MIPLKYLDSIRDILMHLENTQLNVIEKAAETIVNSLKNNGVIFCADIGHGNHLDFMNRAGGLAAVQHFSYSININSPVPLCYNDRPRDISYQQEKETIKFAIESSNMRAGDVIILSSVSGKNSNPIETAIQSRDKGIKVIGMTAIKYANEVNSSHSSGKMLHEVSDIVIDIGAPYGDASVDIPGLDHKALPVSGIAMITCGWMIWGRVIELMASVNDPPSVFMSVNRPGGSEHYKKMIEQYNKRGY